VTATPGLHGSKIFIVIHHGIFISSPHLIPPIFYQLISEEFFTLVNSSVVKMRGPKHHRLSNITSWNNFPRCGTQFCASHLLAGKEFPATLFPLQHDSPLPDNKRVEVFESGPRSRHFLGLIFIGPVRPILLRAKIRCPKRSFGPDWAPNSNNKIKIYSPELAVRGPVMLSKPPIAAAITS